ncbi:MAG: hypothetical protein HN856_16845, partial [Gammaproteobacteria bacterium]|nr:hypothetical protein [Gammaproteobacteria bacterium]
MLSLACLLFNRLEIAECTQGATTVTLISTEIGNHQPLSCYAHLCTRYGTEFSWRSEGYVKDATLSGTKLTAKYPPGFDILIRKDLITLSMVLILGGCWQSNRGPLTGHHTKAPPNFAFIGYTSPCYLELPTVPRSFAVNCFQINGVLHIHSNRFAKWPRLISESWVDTVRRAPEVRVELNGLIYAMIATPVDNEQRRQAIL